MLGLQKCSTISPLQSSSQRAAQECTQQGIHLSTPCPMEAQDLHPPCNKQESQPSPNDVGGRGVKMGWQTRAEDSIDFAVHCADCSQLGKKVKGADGHA